MFALVNTVIGSNEFDDLCAWTPYVYIDMLRILMDREQDLVKRARAVRLLGLGRQQNDVILESLGEIVRAEAEPISLRVASASALGRLALVAPSPRIYDQVLPALDTPHEALQDETGVSRGR
jgi:hypothetical protein